MNKRVRILKIKERKTPALISKHTLFVRDFSPITYLKDGFLSDDRAEA